MPSGRNTGESSRHLRGEAETNPQSRMFSFCPTNCQIPSLTFTKAELVYALSVLTAEIPPTDNGTLLEMVELRYYLTKIKDKVAHAVADGTIGRAMALPEGEGHEDTPPKPKASPMPSMDELRVKFPTLTDEEITEVLERAKKERGKKADESHLPPTSAFVAKPKVEEKPKTHIRPLSKQEEKNRENSRKFATMLGQV